MFVPLILGFIIYPEIFYTRLCRVVLYPRDHTLVHAVMDKLYGGEDPPGTE